jgi:signal transduction histidine kinase
LLLAFGALAIMLAHLVVQPKKRRPIITLLIGFAAAVTPSVIYNSLLLAGINPPVWMIFPTFLSLAFIPLVYFFVFTYRRWGIMEMRANRIAAIVVYGIVIFLGSYVLMMAWSAGTHTILVPFPAIVITTILCGVITALIFPAYQRWFEQRILGVPAPPQGLLVTYADRILTSLDAERLVHLIRDEAFPSLLIRQAALLRIQDTVPPEGINAYNEIFRMNLAQSELPRADELAAIYSQSGQFISADRGNMIGGISWVRLALPLEVSGKLLGLCLFGKRDPDDYYAATEITVLQALMDQTAMALVNIEQNQLLHSLYQDDIQRQESERSRLALELHDDVLGHLAIMAQPDADHTVSQTFLNAYQASVHSIRQIISGLRPPMLDYGLRPALEGLTDEIAALTNNHSQLKLELPASPERFPDAVELHLYRIIQQACRNAVRSGGAHQVIISGKIDTGLVEIHIEDDGTGFDHSGALDLRSLVQNKHFGLAGMYERCALIGAHLKVESSPGCGTHIWLSWQDD